MMELIFGLGCLAGLVIGSLYWVYHDRRKEKGNHGWIWMGKSKFNSQPQYAE